MEKPKPVHHIISNVQGINQNYQECEEIRTCGQCSNKRQSTETNSEITDLMKLPKILKQLFKYIRYHKGKYAQVNRECQKEIENVENNQIEVIELKH